MKWTFFENRGISQYQTKSNRTCQKCILLHTLETAPEHSAGTPPGGTGMSCWHRHTASGANSYGGIKQQKAPADCAFQSAGASYRLPGRARQAADTCYSTSICLTASFAGCSSLGRLTVSTPSQTLASIPSLSTSSGSSSVCSYFE